MKKQRKELSRYIIAALISNLSFFILNIVDGIFVGNGVGIDALGAIGLALPWLLVVNAVAVLFTIGGVAVASVRLGRGDTDGANLAFMHSFASIVVSMFLLTVIGTVWSDQVAGLMGANDTFRELVSTYIFWYSVFLLPAGLYTCLSSFCRNDGNPRLSTVAAIVCTVANIFGDWLLVFPLDKGIGGAAFASGAAQLCSVIVLWFHYTRGMGQLRFRQFKPDRVLFQKVFLRGTPEMMNQFASPITMFSMNNVLIGIGDAHVNAYSVILYAGSLFSALMYGLSTGLQPLYGRSYGAKDDKILPWIFDAEFVWYTLGIAEFICLCIAATLWKRSERDGIVYR